jgi:hypothetical protein
MGRRAGGQRRLVKGGRRWAGGLEGGGGNGGSVCSVCGARMKTTQAGGHVGG